MFEVVVLSLSSLSFVDWIDSDLILMIINNIEPTYTAIELL